MANRTAFRLRLPTFVAATRVQMSLSGITETLRW